MAPTRPSEPPRTAIPRVSPPASLEGSGTRMHLSLLSAVKPRCRAFPAAPTGSRGLGGGAQVRSASPEPALASGLPARQLFVPGQGGTCSTSQSSVANGHVGAALPRTQWVLSKAGLTPFPRTPWSLLLRRVDLPSDLPELALSGGSCAGPWGATSTIFLCLAGPYAYVRVLERGAPLCQCCQVSEPCILWAHP